MSYKSRSASRRNGRKMLRRASRKSASRRRIKTQEDLTKDFIWQTFARLLIAIICFYFYLSL